ncbi:hypothetical protein BDZ97DRAFT_1652125 [Flammula alnicola]|nr:hypothetical protein BDZ97DRAFT_1652125 [Flammula alnicola]
MGLKAPELARWTGLATNSGIGKCPALSDCVAECSIQLPMILCDNEIAVLYRLSDQEGFYLVGIFQGVVGRFNDAVVHSLSKLNKPVMKQRTSVPAVS